MESAIAEHLKCPRSRDRRIADDFTPPFPAWVARPAPSLQQVVMAYLGVQSLGPDSLERARNAFQAIVMTLDAADGPLHRDLAHYVDAQGYDNLMVIAYWTDPEAFRRWEATDAIAGWWSSDERLGEGLGYFREVAAPRPAWFETLFSSPDRLEGVGVIMSGRSLEDVQEHAYWGGARDRIPAAQTDALAPEGELSSSDSPGPGKRVRIRGHENVALIRSGQEWSETQEGERESYLSTMEPVLREGMRFLSEEGLAIGCYTNRYMQHIDVRGLPAEKSFGLSYWRCLGDMERWAESHPTHLAIFGTFMRIVQALNFNLKLRLYHEVTILKPDEQDYEYINCHAKTGLLNAAVVAGGIEAQGV